MSQTSEMLEKIYQAIIMLRGDIDLLKAKLIPEAMPTDEERKVIKDLSIIKLTNLLPTIRR